MCPKVNIFTKDVYQGDIAISACPFQLEWSKETINKATQETYLNLEKRGTNLGKDETKDILNKELYNIVLIKQTEMFIYYFLKYNFSKLPHK